MRRFVTRTGGLGLVTLVILAGCGRRDTGSPPRAAVPLPLRIMADTGRAVPLAVVPPPSQPAEVHARAWLASVSRTAPSRPPAEAGPPAGPSALDVPLPEARSDTLAQEPTPAPSLALDEDLKPPIPIGSAALHLPPLRHVREWVELDVRIDESGNVSDALWAAGSADSAAVAATVTCALAMRFHPALRHGTPVAVWCRQRFELGREGVPRPADETGD